MFRRSAVVGFVLALGVLSPGVAAQEATPSDDFVTPDPAACQVAPRTVDELVAFFATPAAGTPAAMDVATPTGEPADDATVAAVTATLHEIYACTNANAFLRVFALYTDDYLARSMVSEDINPEALGLFATPIAPQAADERFGIAVRDIEALPDGRVSAVVVSRSPYGGGSESAATYILIERDGRWLVDDIITSPQG